MAQLFQGQAFNAAQVDPSSHFDAIPAGDYLVIVAASELKMTKDGNGQYLQLELQIQDGQFHGRKLFDRLNLHNANAKAVEIAQRQLSQLCHATGVMLLTDSEQLHFKPVIAIVKVRTEAGRDPSNEVRGYKAASQQSAAPAFHAPTVAQPAQSTPQQYAAASQGSPSFAPPTAGSATPWLNQKAA